MSTQGLSGGGFDFDTQAGIAHVLASVRAAEISTEQKNDLRDIIFLYTNGGRDQTVRISLEQKIASYGVSPIAKTAPSQAQVQQVPGSPMGFSRSTPDSFSVSEKKTAPPVSPAPAPAPPTPPTPAPQTTSPTPVPTPVAPTPSAPVTPPQPTPTTVPVESPVSPTSPPVVPNPVPQTPQPDQIQPGPGAEANLNRIREIKSLVNQKVGNPVNLVDINNEVGREYMGSLLDAMKKINSGASAVSAMQRLETAYKSVEKAIEEHNVSEAPAAASVSPTPVPTTPPISTPPPVVPNPVPPPIPASNPEPLKVQTPPPINRPLPTPTPPIAPVPPSPQPPTQPTPKPTPPVEKELDNKSESLPVEEKKSRIPIKEVPEPITASSGDDNRWSNDNVPQPGSPAAPQISSLADTLAKKTAEAAEKKEGLQKQTSGDPLYSSEIDSGLDQLLTEWSLFKKSGLFGTGPKGREHPLFKKIAGLQIPLLLAGRFEGATQEIKQSITDYMNGWRYEQGIVYMQGETFERYLRRVIKHILDLQKKKPTA